MFLHLAAFVGWFYIHSLMFVFTSSEFELFSTLWQFKFSPGLAFCQRRAKPWAGWLINPVTRFTEFLQIICQPLACSHHAPASCHQPQLRSLFRKALLVSFSRMPGWGELSPGGSRVSWVRAQNTNLSFHQIPGQPGAQGVHAASSQQPAQFGEIIKDKQPLGLMRPRLELGPAFLIILWMLQCESWELGVCHSDAREDKRRNLRANCQFAQLLWWLRSALRVCAAWETLNNGDIITRGHWHGTAADLLRAAWHLQSSHLTSAVSHSDKSVTMIPDFLCTSHIVFLCGPRSHETGDC